MGVDIISDNRLVHVVQSPQWSYYGSRRPKFEQGEELWYYEWPVHNSHLWEFAHTYRGLLHRRDRAALKAQETSMGSKYGFYLYGELIKWM